jgi:hypothetical protein
MRRTHHVAHQKSVRAGHGVAPASCFEVSRDDVARVLTATSVQILRRSLVGSSGSRAAHYARGEPDEWYATHTELGIEPPPVE